MYDRILVPTDGSGVAGAAADTALAMAGRFGADLHAVHVLETADLLPGVDDLTEDDFGQRGRDAAEAIVDRATEAGIAATAAVIEQTDSVHDAIIEYAAENDVDCIVMGTYGRTGIDRFVLGSVAERTLRESPVPVMTVHEETVFDADFETLLLPTDGSDCARAATDHAISLAAATDASLHVINVVDLGVVAGDIDVGTVLEALEDAGERALEDVRDRAEESVPRVEAAVLNGSPHRSIVEYATENDVDCIVMGTHGRTGIERYLLGSVTERVVRLSEVPVLAVKHDEQAR